MDDGKLKMRSVIELISPGYDKEEVTPEPGSTPFVDAPLEGERDLTYTFRDSNLSNPNNGDSIRVVVKMTERWKVTKGSNNTYRVITEGWLDKIYRDDKRGYVDPKLTRRIRISGAAGVVYQSGNINPAQEGVTFQGHTYLGKREYYLRPQTQTAYVDMSADVLSYAVNYWNGKDLPNTFVDQIRFGIQFRNELEEECDPPVYIGAKQYDDICENVVQACLTFGPCSCEGMALEVQYHFAGQSWGDAERQGYTTKKAASHTSNTTVCFDDLPPTNHTWNPVRLYWRARFVPDTAQMPETDWVEGWEQMMFILHPHETVPDISTEECSFLKRGELIGKYESGTCYNEFGCADMDVKNPSQEADVEDCKKVNGVK